MPSNLEEKVNQCLVAANLTMPLLAEKMGLPEPELYALCRHGDPRLSELIRLAKCLRVPPTYFVNGSFNQAGVGNTQKIKIGKAAAHELAAQLGVCRRALEQSRQLVAAKDALLASQEVVIVSKEEIINLLRTSYNRPN
jgi:transcriptional regulator with XRE-family HTH domain